MDLKRVRKLEVDDDLGSFDSGVENLNQWFKKFAFSDQRAGVSVTYVLERGERVIGFYTLAPHAIGVAEAEPRLAKGLPRGRLIPVILLARLGLDRSEHGQDLGGDLLRHALLRCAGAAEEIGGRAVVVHAKDVDAALFYQRHDFQPLQENPNHLYILMKDLRASIRSSDRDS